MKVRSILDKLIYNDKYETIDQSMSCSNLGARKNRNIRDHLFVINAILNDVTKRKKNVDIEIMDIAKCFDKMWYEETGNDIFNAGITDDKFVLLANSNLKCQVAVRTPWGSISDRVVLERIEMQGTVPAPLKASVQLDTLGKECIENVEGLFKYKDCVNITPLIFIDDVLSVSNCGNEAVKTNAIIHSKVDTKQLMFGPSKCFKLHVGNGCRSACPTLKVHGQVMTEVNKEKYLGDFLSNDGKINVNIQERQNKGNGYVNQIVSMLKEVSFGYHYFDRAMLFRTTMLVNGMLCSIEALHGITKPHVNQLESCDKDLFRQIFKSPCTTPTAAYYLETGATKIQFLLRGLRIMFLWNILQKSDDELVRKVYNAQKLLSVKDDWIHHIEDDLDVLGIPFDEEKIRKTKKFSFKKLVNDNIREASHSSLLQDKKGKLVNLSSDYGMKEYLSSEKISLEQKQLLFNLRTRMIPVKCNYKRKYEGNLLCTLCDTQAEESQEHLLVCPSLLDKIDVDESVKYMDIFDSLDKQVKAVKYISEIMSIRKVQLKEQELSQGRNHVHC